jgi:hypothetical protein
MAQLTRTALATPQFLAKIDNAMREAVQLSATRRNHGTAYVANRHGHNVLRVSYWRGQGFRFWGDQARDITDKVLSVLRASEVSQ